ncbi:glycosyltransferase family 2 protein [Allopusillimonas soli]|uniref:Glycosyltransferase family 2 protein n=1 Tax=Allopusillimonas soli TaxID=659016 RepID=A0A853FB92_9BURK|nr:glycosyltransferase family 2 protein [Allopusillimonas soli]NYT38025.1 glycosyltransferase family 2 protein [Allopusillimonas soli]TEA73917.1 glycosyltransferase family 2 protein [Allopusillimonas soli]
MNQDDRPLVSIVMPAYNAEDLIERTIDSVVSQSYGNWELLVVDDCSKDGTRSVVERLAQSDGRIRLVPLEHNNGAPAAPRNIGVSLARGEFVALLDADDLWHPRKLELQVPILRGSSAPLCCTQMTDFVDDSDVVYAEPGSVSTERITFEKQRLKSRIPNSSVLARRDVLVAVPFNESPAYKAVEDYDCSLRILKSFGDAIKIKYPLLRYRKVEGQISGSKLKMLRRVFMVHRNLPESNIILSCFFLFTYVVGSLYFRLWKKSL